MASRFFGYLTHQRCAITPIPDTRGRWLSSRGAISSRQSLPTDPVGITTVTFDGVVAGSEIRVYDPDLNELAGVESCTANHVLTWPVYAAGSSNNNVQIKIINTAYRIKDFPYTSKVGNQSIPVQMEPDKWFSNPA